MEHNKSNSKTASINGNHLKDNAKTVAFQTSQLMELLEDQLKDIFWAEKALTKTIPKMIKKATSLDLIDVLTNHLAETHNQTIRVVKIFESMDTEVRAKKCEAMKGLIKEAEGILDSCETGAICDAEIISAAQKMKHYEIATYGILRQFADTLGLIKAVKLLETSLIEENVADDKLTKVATTAIHIEAELEYA